MLMRCRNKSIAEPQITAYLKHPSINSEMQRPAGPIASCFGLSTSGPRYVPKQPILKAGFLKKKGGSRRGMLATLKQALRWFRFFVLDSSGQLAYFKNEEAFAQRRPRGIVIIDSNATAILQKNESSRLSSNWQGHLELHFQPRPASEPTKSIMRLQARDLTSAQEWVALLNRISDARKRELLELQGWEDTVDTTSSSGSHHSHVSTSDSLALPLQQTNQDSPVSAPSSSSLGSSCVSSVSPALPFAPNSSFTLVKEGTSAAGTSVLPSTRKEAREKKTSSSEALDSGIGADGTGSSHAAVSAGGGSSELVRHWQSRAQSLRASS